MTADVRYFRFALFADHSSSGSSFSRRFKEALESQGHTVFLFDPAMQPFVLARKGVIRGYMVRRFFQVQRLDGVFFADGLVLDYPETARAAAGAPMGWVLETPEQAEGLLRNMPEGDAWAPDFAVAAGEGVRALLEEDGRIPRLHEAVEPESTAALLEALKDGLSLEGCARPRSIACVFGYIGTNNYANNRILSSIDERLRGRVEGSSVVAISMNPQHTLENRGVYAIGMKDKRSLDVAISYAGAVLVIAGVMNDQGVRDSMGNAEIFSNMGGCSMHAMAALATLSRLNDAQMVLYGGGAGPLDLADSRKLVDLMAKLGMRFIARDEGTAEVLRAAKVPEGALMMGAEPLSLASASPTDYVDKWLAERGIDASKERFVAVTLRSGDGFPADFPQRVATVFKAALEEQGDLRIILCALDGGDSRLLDKVKAAVGMPERVNIFHAGANAEAVCDMLSRAYVGFSMQYYGTLALMRAGIACMGVSCQAKESALFSEVGCEELSLAPDVSEDEMLGALKGLLANREALCERVVEGMGQVRARALVAEDYVVEQMACLGEGKAYGVEVERYPHVVSASEREHAQEVEGLKEQLRELEERCDRAYREMASREYRFESALGAIPRRLGLLK